MDFAFGVLCVLVGAGRLWILVHPAAPPGIDAGNWLAFGRGLLGHPVRSTSIAYPPLVPLLVLAASALGSPGIAVVAAVTSLAPGLGVYHATRRAGTGGGAIVSAGFLLAATSIGAPAAWGGYPQLLGLGLTVGFLTYASRYLGDGARRDGFCAGGLLLADLATSHFTTSVAFLGLVVIALDCLIRGGPASRASRARQLAGRTALLALVALPFVPLYTRIVTSIATSGSDFSGGQGQSDLIARVNHSTTALGLAGLVVVLVSPMLVPRARLRHLWATATAVVVAGTGLLIVTDEARFAYVLPVGAALVTACWIGELRASENAVAARAGTALTALVALAALGQGIVAPANFRRQRDKYGVLTPGSYSAIQWLRAHTRPDATVAVTAIGGSPLGWWVEGLAGRRTLTASRLEWLSFPDERRRARLANLIFGRLPADETLDLALKSGADYLFIAKAWEGYSGAQVPDFETRHRGAITFENSDAVILATQMGAHREEAR